MRVPKMLKYWLPLELPQVFLALPLLSLLLGQCQCLLTRSSDEPQLAAMHEIHGNNTNMTLASVEHPLDTLVPLAPPAASLGPLSQRRLSRGKRFVAFPLGSSASASVCLTTGVLGNPNLLYFSLGINWGIAWDLPNITWVLQNAHGFNTKKPDAMMAAIKRRDRRDLYGNLGTMIDSMGYNGRDCILRTLCESRQFFQRTKMNMIGEMLRAIFSLPKQRIFKRELEENADIKHYDNAYRYAHDFDCARQYSCQFSLLELAFGKHSTPPTNYYA